MTAVVDSEYAVERPNGGGALAVILERFRDAVVVLTPGIQAETVFRAFNEAVVAAWVAPGTGDGGGEAAAGKGKGKGKDKKKKKKKKKKDKGTVPARTEVASVDKLDFAVNLWSVFLDNVRLVVPSSGERKTLLLDFDEGAGGIGFG